MFDLTPEINLDKKSYALYRKWQVALYLIVVLLVLYLAFLILFPHKVYTFSFLNPSSRQNSLDYPLLKNRTVAKKGLLKAKNKLIFDTTLVGDYSKATIYLNLKSSLSQPSSLAIFARKSFKSFFYPEGNPIGFKNGSLLKNAGRYFIVSHNQLRQLASLKVLSQLGYTPENFQSVSNDELKYNPLGQPIKETTSYPDDTLFKIGHIYYLLDNQQLKAFSSSQAFATQYNPKQAIVKTVDFLKKYPLADKKIGFADGTLISNATSAYIISQGQIFPINNAQTFLIKGYQWKNLVPAGEDELALYKRASLFRISSPQPDGTIFKTNEGTFYLIKGNKKHLLPGKDIAQSWLAKNSPILVSKNLNQTVQCSFKKSILKPRVYHCQISLDNFSQLLGSDYEFTLSSQKEIKINTLKIIYSRNVNLVNFKEALKRILNSILERYAQNRI